MQRFHDAKRAPAELVRDVGTPRPPWCGIARSPTEPPQAARSKLHALGGHHQIELRDGVERTYAWYQDQDQDPATLRRA